MHTNLTTLPIDRRWQAQQHPMPSVLAVVRQTLQNRVHYVLIKRIKEPYSGKWALVGGKWNFGESLDDAVCREVREETGLDTRFVALRGIVNERMHPGSRTQDGGHFLLFICEVDVLEGEATEQSEGEVAWFTMEELQERYRQQDVVPIDYHILEYYYDSTQSLQYIEADIIVGKNEKKMFDIVRFDVIP
ncbi:MAG: hypothetical protein KatS3mg057_0673 [Herpetosiphonaceae bacterium]|nr:MAG: hypothetical protein KatS3mg057_0673 [Herpetosiphonaceae bacterium]